MRAPCEHFESVLVNLAAGSQSDPAMAHHAATCLACQSALVRHRRLLRILSELRTDEMAMPATLLNGVLDAVARAATRSAARATRSRYRAGSALSLVGAALLVGVVVAARRFIRRPGVATTGRQRPRRASADPGIQAAFELLSSSCQAGAVRSIDRVGEHRRGQ